MVVDPLLLSGLKVFLVFWCQDLSIGGCDELEYNKIALEKS